MKKIFLGLAAAAAIFAAVSCGGGSKKAKFHYLKISGDGESQTVTMVTDEFELKEGKLPDSATVPTLDTTTKYKLTAKCNVGGITGEQAIGTELVGADTNWYKKAACGDADKWTLKTDGTWEKGDYWAKYKVYVEQVTVTIKYLDWNEGGTALEVKTITQSVDKGATSFTPSAENIAKLVPVVDDGTDVYNIGTTAFGVEKTSGTAPAVATMGDWSTEASGKLSAWTVSATAPINAAVTVYATYAKDTTKMIVKIKCLKQGEDATTIANGDDLKEYVTKSADATTFTLSDANKAKLVDVKNSTATYEFDNKFGKAGTAPSSVDPVAWVIGTSKLDALEAGDLNASSPLTVYAIYKAKA